MVEETNEIHFCTKKSKYAIWLSLKILSGKLVKSKYY